MPLRHLRSRYQRPQTDSQPARLLLQFLPALLILLGSCSTPPPAEVEQQDPTTEIIALVEDKTPDVDRLLVQAAKANPRQAAELFYQAALMLSEQGEASQALDVLGFIDLEAAQDEQLASIQLLKARLLLAGGDPGQSLAQLQNGMFPTQGSLSPSTRVSYYLQRAAAFSAQNNPLSSLLERIQLDRLLPFAEQNNNHDQIWISLKQLPVSRLRTLSASAQNEDIKGWYELSLASRAISTDLDQQSLEVRRWQNNWPGHPAALRPPNELSLSLQAKSPEHIALLLPLGTGAGIVIRDAFLSAYYNLQEFGGDVPVITVYDTTNFTDILALHTQARNEGAQLIVGPLLKQHVNQLTGVADLGVPTLALNSADGVRPASALLYQFTLSPENEGVQIARKAWGDGRRIAAVLAPTDDPDNDFYTRKRQSFLGEWLTLGGKTVSVNNFSDEYTNTISDLLELDASNARRTRLQAVLGQNVVFTQRRRQDIDFIFLIAQPAAARQIIPSLAYLFAGDIPVYASQDLYSGVPRPVEDRDLNGVLFPESPWLLGRIESNLSKAKNLFPATTAQNLRLQAFGIDAFRLVSRLPVLEASSEYSLSGTSGQLRLGPEHNVIRELEWATITDGVIQPIER